MFHVEWPLLNLRDDSHVFVHSKCERCKEKRERREEEEEDSPEYSVDENDSDDEDDEMKYRRTIERTTLRVPSKMPGI